MREGGLASAVRLAAGVLVTLSGLGAAILLFALQDPGGTVLLETLGADANRTRAVIAAAAAAVCALAGIALWLPPLRGEAGSAGAKLAGATIGLVLALPGVFVAAALSYALAGLAA